MRIYLWNENCVQGGQVAGLVDDESAAMIDADEEVDWSELVPRWAPGDLHYREGSEEELIAEAKLSLRTRYDKRPGGAGDAFRWKCDRAVLAYLGQE